MEASENTGPPRDPVGAPGLHRIDRNHVGEILRSGGSRPGYERLGLMLGTILPRLTEEPAGPSD